MKRFVIGFLVFLLGGLVSLVCIAGFVGFVTLVLPEERKEIFVLPEEIEEIFGKVRERITGIGIEYIELVTPESQMVEVEEDYHNSVDAEITLEDSDYQGAKETYLAVLIDGVPLVYDLPSELPLEILAKVPAESTSEIPGVLLKIVLYGDEATALSELGLDKTILAELEKSKVVAKLGGLYVYGREDTAPEDLRYSVDVLLRGRVVEILGRKVTLAADDDTLSIYIDEEVIIRYVVEGAVKVKFEDIKIGDVLTAAMILSCKNHKNHPLIMLTGHVSIFSPREGAKWRP